MSMISIYPHVVPLPPIYLQSQLGRNVSMALLQHVLDLRKEIHSYFVFCQTQTLLWTVNVFHFLYSLVIKRGSLEKSSIYRGFVVIYIYIYRGFPGISPWLLKKVLHDAWELHQGSLDTAGVLNTQEPGSGNSNGTCGFQALEITYFLWLEIRVRNFHRSDDLLNELKGIFGDTVEMRIDASQKCSQLVQDWACVAIPYPQPFRCCCLFPISFNTIIKHSENRANLWYPHRKPHRTPLMGVNHNSFLAIDITPNYGSSLWFQQIMMRFPFHGDIRFIFDLICIIFIYTYLLFYIWLYNCKD